MKPCNICERVLVTEGMCDRCRASFAVGGVDSAIDELEKLLGRIEMPYSVAIAVATQFTELRTRVAIVGKASREAHDQIAVLSDSLAQTAGGAS